MSTTNETKFDVSREFLLVLDDENEKQNNENICEICEKKLSSKYVLMQHMKNQHPNGISSAIYSCDHCNKKFLRKFRLISHLKLKHQKGKEIKFECDFDGKFFETKNNLYRHMKYHQALKTCKICGKKVKKLKDHMKNVHAENDDKVNCQICNKSFKNQITFKLHLKTHNKKYQCQVCGRKFTKTNQFKEHMKVHEDKFAFRCKKCQKNFNYSSSLRHHLKTHDKNRPKPIKCQHCDYSTDEKQNLTLHLRIHDKNREKNLKCSKCDYKTDRKGTLKKHLQIHDPYRVKYPCPACNYEATERSSLTIHIKRKHDPKKKENKSLTSSKKNFLK